MYLKQIVVACLATALAGGAMAQQLTLKSGGDETLHGNNPSPFCFHQIDEWTP
jgi:hypothetical protein